MVSFHFILKKRLVVKEEAFIKKTFKYFFLTKPHLASNWSIFYIYLDCHLFRRCEAIEITRIMRVAIILLLLSGSCYRGSSFSMTFTDRFRAKCPADLSEVIQFDPSLNVNSNDEAWVAVYRSSNNLPSVLLQDDFRNAMRIATSIQNDGISQSTSVDYEYSRHIETGVANSDSSSTGVKAKIPIAVAKIAPSVIEGKYVLSEMRCSLKKEDQNVDCDGNSEHCEAISICIDELIIHHLSQGKPFDNSIRVKATLVSGKLLEERGFQEIDEMSKDMATHISSLDSCLVKFAERAVASVSKNLGARERALK